MSKELTRITVVVGTRPEAIKMAPVIMELKARPDEFLTTVVSTGQHRQMLDQSFALFNIVPDLDMNVMQPGQALSALTGAVIAGMDEVIATCKPDIVLVQGDTTSVFAASLACFYHKVPVGHVEAGLRSHDLRNPFPEEANRRLTTVLADLHFAPTMLAKTSLLHEHVPFDSVFATGNTVVDALLHVRTLSFDPLNTQLQDIPFGKHRVILVTSHRRESWGADLENICFAIRDLIKIYEDVIVVFPVHMNPVVRNVVLSILSGHKRIFTIDPLDYQAFVYLIGQSYLILTDSGGIQEEAPTFRKPVLVMRSVTERPEACQAGLAKIIGTDRDDIVHYASRLLSDEDAYEAMRVNISPFGDGRASQRIADILVRWRHGDYPLIRGDEEFFSNHQVSV